jgi:hypothetical protein
MNDEPTTAQAEGPGYTLATPTGHEPIRKSRSSSVQRHTCTVTLPAGSTCTVEYNRFGQRSHRFYFSPPVREHVWLEKPLSGGVGVIEAAAQNLTAEAFLQAQRTEQKDMRRATPPFQWRPEPGERSHMDKKTAERQAGRYAVCVRFPSGHVMAIGPGYDEPEQPTKELTAGKYASCVLYTGQVMQVCICCRFARRWQEPLFLLERVVVEGTVERTALKRPGKAVRSSKRTRRAAPASPVGTATPVSAAKAPPRDTAAKPAPSRTPRRERKPSVDAAATPQVPEDVGNPPPPKPDPIEAQEGEDGSQPQTCEDQPSEAQPNEDHCGEGENDGAQEA